jgi:PAS domain S-box-containing protein
MIKLMKQFFQYKWISGYKSLVSSGNDIYDKNFKRGDIAYWRDALFISLLHYCLPISLVTVLPGILIITKEQSNSSLAIELFVFCSLIIVTFAKFLKLRWRKFILVSIFYILSIYHISVIGYQGPGMFYLLVITVLIALILPIRFAYYSIIVSAFISGAFAVEYYIIPARGAWADRYHINQLLVLSLSLIFSQLTIISLIDKIFDRLQITIHTKDKLRENYLRIFDSSPIPMWVFDIETLQFLAVNETAIRQYGYTKNEFLALTIQVLRPKDHQRALSDLVAFNKDQIEFRKDHVMHLTKDGEVLFVDIDSRLLTYKGRNAKLVLATNISEKVKALEENYQSILKIKQSEANLQAIFNSTSEGFLLLDETYKIISFNEKAANAIFLNKNNRSFEIGHSIFEFVEELRQTELKSHLDRADQGSVVEYELKFMIDGRELWMHYTIMPVYQDGLKKGICINGRDITDYKTYVQTIEKQNAKLRDISWTQSHMVRAPLARIMALYPLIRTASNPAELEMLLSYLEISCEELDTVVRKIVIETENS